MNKAKYRILIAEDDPPIRDVLEEVLVSEGFEVELAPDGLAARQRLEREPNFDLLISDFRMPRMDGADLLAWCRTSGIHFPVVFMSADRILLPKEEVALGDCCASVLQKPFRLEKLLEEVIAAKARNHARECNAAESKVG